MTTYFNINFDTFPISHGKIKIPKDTLLYRWYDPQYPINSSRPAYFTSNFNLATAYAKLSPNGKVGVFRVSRDIHLYDLRYMKNIISDIFTHRKSDVVKAIEICSTLALSYGICSLNTQIKLFEQRYEHGLKTKDKNLIKYTLKNIKEHYDNFIKKPLDYKLVNPIEPQGFRYGETTNDTDSVLILKQLFSHNNLVNGYIAPELKTPFHTELKDSILYSEILLFTPREYLEQLKESELNTLRMNSIKTISITKLLKKENLTRFNLDGFEDFSFYLKGGNSPTYEYEQREKYYVYRDPNELLDIMSESRYERLNNKYEYATNLLIHGDYIAEHIKHDPFCSIPNKYGIVKILEYKDFNTPRDYIPVQTFQVSPWIVESDNE